MRAFTASLRPLLINWGLRVYGIDPVVWGGGEGCPHEWVDTPPRRKRGTDDVRNSPKQASNKGTLYEAQGGHFCRLCGAWRGELGLEPTPESYLQHIVEVFREIRRVLRDDGVVWLNLGSSYAGGKGRSGVESQDYQDKRVRAGQSLNRVQQVGGPGQTRALDDRAALRASGLKPKDLAGIPWRVALALQADGWWLRSDVVWCLSGGARVYAKTQKGEMPMVLKDLVRLKPETVQLWNGNQWTQCLEWSQAKSRESTLEIEFRNGERIGCTPGHRWPTERGMVEARHLRLGDIVLTCRLPGCNRNNPSFLQHKIGWFIGHYLAEGSRSGSTLRIACNIKEMPTVERKWRALAEGYGGSVHAHKLRGNAAVVCVESSIVMAILDKFITGRTAKNKGLKVAVWRHNDLFLDSLLQGYLDGDGHYDEKNDRYRLGFTRNDRLAADLRTLCARLGYELRLKISMSSCNGKRYPSYRGQLRKIAKAHHNTKENGQVIALRKSRARTFWNIAVADKPHLFALASGLLTCNSKKNPMPESVNGWRYERHRIKVTGQQVPDSHKREQSQYMSDVHTTPAKWQDCPGCPKCDPNDGLVLRRGSWRPTRAHETIFMLTKSETYFCDAEAVREPCAPATLEQDKHTRVIKGEDGSHAVRHDHETPSNPAGRNLRSVWHLATQPFSMERCKNCGKIFFSAEYRRLKVVKKKKKCDRCGSSEWESHFSAFPEALVEKCLLAATSPKACPKCGAPWARVIERRMAPPEVFTDTSKPDDKHVRPVTVNGKIRGAGQKLQDWRNAHPAQTLGFRPTCSCTENDGSAKCVILDPFSGAGTVAAVAVKHGRHFVGIDLRPEYNEMAKKRLGAVQPELLFAEGR